MNRITLIGRLGGNAELRYTPSGASVLNFSMATSRQWKDRSGELKEETTWHNIVCFGKLSERGKTLTKGSLVFVEGDLKIESWEKDGVKRSAAKIMANVIYKCQPLDGGLPPQQGASAPAKPPVSQQPYTEEDIPF